MPNEMIERVANAIHNKLKERGYNIIANNANKHLAVTAIEAMREPTEKMLKAAKFYDAQDDYEAMIDAALKEE